MNMEWQHVTPGPWRVDMPGHPVRGGTVVAQIGGEWVEIADQIDPGDARLIAAAPEMLHQCQEWADSMDLIVHAQRAGLEVLATVLKHRQEWARAAIARVRGESNA